MPSFDSPYAAGMGKVSNSALVSRQNSAGMSKLHTAIAKGHLDKQESSYGRTQEFHGAAARANMNVADQHLENSQKNVVNLAEPVSTYGVRTRDRGNYTGRYN